ncbi:unnamed protein product [Calypogeia fissa]
MKQRLLARTVGHSSTLNQESKQKERNPGREGEQKIGGLVFGHGEPKAKGSEGWLGKEGENKQMRNDNTEYRKEIPIGPRLQSSSVAAAVLVE